MNVEYTNYIDVSDYNFLRKSMGWNEISAAKAQKGLDNSAHIVVAKLDGKTIGMARVISDGGYFYAVADVIVLQDYQKKGIGKRMMNEIMDFIHANIEAGDTVFVFLMAANGKEPFYNQFGFITRPDVDAGAGMSQYISKQI